MFIQLLAGFCENLIEVQTRLLDQLLGKYDKRILPQHNASDPVPLSLGMRLLNLVELVSIPWVKVFRINPEFRILRLTFQSQSQNAELGRL